MKKTKVFSVAVALFFAVFTLMACVNNSPIQRIDFEPNNGEAITTIEFRLNSEIVPPNPTKNGFVFDGWYWDDGIWEQPFTINSILDQPLSAQMNLRVFAKWRNRNAVIFDANGGTGTMNHQVIPEGSSAQLSAIAFAREGYSFGGWATSPSGSIVYYDTAAFDMAANGGVTLYAVWISNYVVITFNGNGATQGNYQQSVLKNADTALTPNTFTRYWTWQWSSLDSPYNFTGYFEFLGWATRPDGDVVYPDGAVINTETDLNLYAVWIWTYITIHFEIYFPGFGSMELMQFVQPNTDTALIIMSYRIREDLEFGYEFAGWATSEDSDEVVYADGAIVNIAESLRLFSVWTPIN